MCSEEGCDRPPAKSRKGWCASCYYRWRTYGDPRAPGSRVPQGDVAAYFRAHLGEDGPGCLIWPYSSSNGYGQVYLDGNLHRVSRLACEHQWGPPPAPGMDAAHLPVICHDRLCWRGLHLRWATRHENVADMELDGTTLRGEVRWTSRLTEAQVLEIRSRYGQGGVTQDQLSREYGITPNGVSRIITRKTWKHV